MPPCSLRRDKQLFKAPNMYSFLETQKPQPTSSFHFPPSTKPEFGTGTCIRDLFKKEKVKSERCREQKQKMFMNMLFCIFSAQCPKMRHTSFKVPSQGMCFIHMKVDIKTKLWIRSSLQNIMRNLKFQSLVGSFLTFSGSVSLLTLHINISCI